MSKKHGKSKKDNVQTNSINIYLPEYLDKNELQHVIANALIESEEIKNQREKQQQEEELKSWREAMGYKDFSDTKWYLRWFLRLCNNLYILYKNLLTS